MVYKGNRGRGVGVSAGLLVGACALLLAGCQEEKVAEVAKPEPKPAKVMVVSANDGFYTRSFTGRVEAVQTVDLAFRVSGQVIELPIRESQQVSKGDLIAAIDPTDYENAVLEAQVNFDQAKRDLERFSTLKDKEVISQGSFDKAKTSFDIAKVSLKKAKEKLSYTKIFAPYDAVIAKRLVDNYTIISSGTSIVRVQDVSEVQVDINVPETLFARAKNNTKVAIFAEFSAAPGKRYPLIYRENSSEADNVTQTYRVTLAMPKPTDIEVFPGMTVNVKVEATGAGTPVAGSFLIPSTAIGATAQNEPFVWIVDTASNAVTKRPVKVGQLLGPVVPVVDGLTSGETIITAGTSYLQEGQVIQPVN